MFHKVSVAWAHLSTTLRGGYHTVYLWEEGVPKGQGALSAFEMPNLNIFIGETDLRHCMGLIVNQPVGTEQRLLHLASELNWFKQQLAVTHHFGVMSLDTFYSLVVFFKCRLIPDLCSQADGLPQCCCAKLWNPTYLWRHTFVVELLILPMKEVTL